jgi:hypothetical protein
MADERLLHRTEASVSRQAFDRGHLSALALRRECQARQHLLAVKLHRAEFPCSSEPLRPWILRRTTVVGEVPQPGVYRRELRFEIGDRLPDVRRRFHEFALVLARALAQGGDRDRDPADTMLKALALELSAQCVGGSEGGCVAAQCRSVGWGDR